MHGRFAHIYLYISYVDSSLWENYSWSKACPIEGIRVQIWNRVAKSMELSSTILRRHQVNWIPKLRRKLQKFATHACCVHLPDWLLQDFYQCSCTQNSFIICLQHHTTMPLPKPSVSQLLHLSCSNFCPKAGGSTWSCSTWTSDSAWQRLDLQVGRRQDSKTLLVCLETTHSECVKKSSNASEILQWKPFLHWSWNLQ